MFSLLKFPPHLDLIICREACFGSLCSRNQSHESKFRLSEEMLTAKSFSARHGRQYRRPDAIMGHIICFKTTTIVPTLRRWELFVLCINIVSS